MASRTAKPRAPRGPSEKSGKSVVLVSRSGQGLIPVGGWESPTQFQGQGKRAKDAAVKADEQLAKDIADPAVEVGLLSVPARSWNFKVASYKQPPPQLQL